MKTKYTYNVAITRFYSVESDRELTDFELVAEGLGKWTYRSTESAVEEDCDTIEPTVLAHYEPTPEQE